MNRIRQGLGLLTVLLLSACAVTSPYEEVSDPLEPVNRAVFAFNDRLDRAVLRPVAGAYEARVPAPIRSGVSNFFANLGEPVTIANDLLQANWGQGIQDSSRFIFNSSFGLLGLVDIATPMGLPRHDEDFGQTFARWGFGEGWYLVLPLLGPSNVRDVIGLEIEIAMDPVFQVDKDDLRYSLLILRAVDQRARLLGASRVMDTVSMDDYVFTRDVYRQNRWNRIHNGNPPPPDFFDDEGLGNGTPLPGPLEMELDAAAPTFPGTGHAGSLASPLHALLDTDVFQPVSLRDWHAVSSSFAAPVSEVES